MSDTFNADMRKLTKKLSDLEKKQIPFASSLALNKLAVLGQRAAVRGLAVHIDKPTPFTKRGIRVRRSNKSNLVSAVFVQDIQAEYLRFAVFGGNRKPKGRALIIPVQQRLNQYGNLPKNKIKNLMARDDTFALVNSPRAGIYQRLKNGRLKLLVSFKGGADYRSIYPFKQIVVKEVQKYVESAFRSSLQRALSSAK